MRPPSFPDIIQSIAQNEKDKTRSMLTHDMRNPKKKKNMEMKISKIQMKKR